MPPEQIPAHLNGFEDYMRSINYKDDDKLIYTISRLRRVTFVIGCVMIPGFDGEGKAIQFLKNFNGRLNGLLFIHKSVIDYDGEPLATP